MSQSFKQIAIKAKELDDAIEKFDKDLKLALTDLVTFVAAERKNYRLEFEIENSSTMQDYKIALSIRIGFAKTSALYCDLPTLLEKSKSSLLDYFDVIYEAYLNERKGRM